MDWTGGLTLKSIFRLLTSSTLCFFALQLLGTEISSVDEAWFVKRKEQTYWVLNELLTNVHLSITCLVPRHLLGFFECVSGNEARALQCSCGMLIWYNDELFTEVRLFSPITMG